MAETRSAWGIEIGQAGLKAIKLRYADNAQQVVAVAYDYVPHAKLLNQPDAVPDDLIRQALDTFLSRNPIGSDLVAISLPGQNALAKFIQLPPVEQSKVAEIVKYEARQQIPFPLEEVIWDFQALGGGIEESGYLLDGEVGLFAMKREQVEHHLQPFLERKVEVELIQIAPLSLYNFLCYDRLGYRKNEPREPSDDYSVVVDMGSDATTLMVTNGKKIWIRNMPVGGNHFTRALTKEMKLTFAKAEHLKCNATKAPDPRAVFQALRPVFNDYVSEIQRSIGFFSSVNRNAKITRLIGVGNGFRLAGLQKYLQQNLQYEVERVDTFQALVGDNVLNAPLFQENLLTFCVPYGLALQCLKLTDIHTTLLPPEIAVARKIRRKKPWAVATAATVLLGLATSAAGFGNVFSSVSTARFGEAETAAEEVSKLASKLKSEYEGEVGKNKTLQANGEVLVTALNSRDYWLEVYKAIDECLPRDTDNRRDESELAKMDRISIRSITTKKYDDLGSWFNEPVMTLADGPAKLYSREDKDLEAGAKSALLIAKPEYEINDRSVAPSGAGYVFTLNGVHYHHEDKNPKGKGATYVAEKFLKNLQSWAVKRESSTGGPPVETPIRLIGITHATLPEVTAPTPILFTPGRKSGPSGGTSRGNPFGMGPGRTLGGGRGSDDDEGLPGVAAGGIRPTQGGEAGADKTVQLQRTVFKVVFAWKPTPLADRKPWPVELPKPGEGAPLESGNPNP
jgi:type IV pilus assembly protein PilM